MQQRFRKLPIEVDAWQLPVFEYKHRNVMQPPEFLADALAHGRVTARPDEEGNLFLFIETLEGRMKAIPGDWIVRGVQGELYPVKPDIFAATYEQV